MLCTLLGLLAAAFFGVFFGSAGEMEPQLVARIFWGLIALGATCNGLLILQDWGHARHGAGSSSAESLRHRPFDQAG
jgi:hypothetical protein